MIPEKYLDGCTFFPDKFGKVDHSIICLVHDVDYWYSRTVLGKIKADIDWLVGINRIHMINTLRWRSVVLLSSIVGFIGLSTFGWYFWARRHKWDDL